MLFGLVHPLFFLQAEDGIRDKAHSAVVVIGHIGRERLTVHPAICCGMELLDIDLPDRRQGQIVDKHQQMLSDETEGTFRSTLIGAMSKVATPLLQERS